jgi:hypothetical protein
MTRLDSKINVPEDVLFHELSGEAVILNLASGKYYGLDEIGTRMWILMAEHGSLEPAYEILLTEYDVDKEQLKEDLLELVDNLSEHGLLQIAPA